MKTCILFVLLSTLLFSCQDIERLSSNLQAVKEGNLFFRADELSASFQEDGRLLISGSVENERISFIISTLDQVVLPLGGESYEDNVAIYEEGNNNVYTTATPEANGLLNLRLNADNTVSGEFNFTAINLSNGLSKNFNRGFIFQIPIINENENEPVFADDSFTATVNTVPFDPDVIASAVNNGQLLISGQTNLATIRLSVPVTTPPGTYTLAEGTDFFGLYIVNQETSFSTSGELIITLNENDLIIGSFDYITANGFAIIGEFTINY